MVLLHTLYEGHINPCFSPSVNKHNVLGWHQQQQQSITSCVIAHFTVTVFRWFLITTNVIGLMRDYTSLVSTDHICVIAVVANFFISLNDHFCWHFLECWLTFRGGINPSNAHICSYMRDQNTSCQSMGEKTPLVSFVWIDMRDKKHVLD